MKTPITLLTLLALPLAARAADVTGTWKAEFDSQIGFQKYTYTLKQEGTHLTGKASSEVNDQKREAELAEGRVNGDKISFVELLNFEGNDLRITYTGTILTSEMKLTREVGTFAKEDIVAKRGAGDAQPAAGSGGQRGRGRGGFASPRRWVETWRHKSSSRR